MRIIVLVIAGLLVVGALFPSPQIHQGIAAASNQGSIGGIVFGLLLCTPIFGLFVIFRHFARWQRSFHERMQSHGVFSERDRRR